LEQYVAWMREHRYSTRCVIARVPALIHFGDFARDRGAATWDQLPEHVEPFIEHWVRAHYRRDHKGSTATFARRLRRPIHQFLGVITPAAVARPARPEPLAARVPGYFDYLRTVCGLRERSLGEHRRLLRLFEAYLDRIELRELRAVSPAVLGGFVTTIGAHYGKRTVQRTCAVLKGLFRYLHQASAVDRDLSKFVEAPRQYRLARIPRAISWDEVRRLLDAVDRRTPVGKRDYAILLLLVTYGLRAREVAALRPVDIDWKRERLQVPDRKAGHSTAYPLSPIVGDAIVDYLKNGRPDAPSPALFVHAAAPYAPINDVTVSQRAHWYLRKIDLGVPHAGSHTLRHACVQRLVDAQLSLKAIGDYVGHRSPTSTAVYTKIDIEGLREVALGNGEAIL
jgi:site-specific recombinase XerD